MYDLQHVQIKVFFTIGQLRRYNVPYTQGLTLLSNVVVFFLQFVYFVFLWDAGMRDMLDVL